MGCLAILAACTGSRFEPLQEQSDASSEITDGRQDGGVRPGDGGTGGTSGSGEGGEIGAGGGVLWSGGSGGELTTENACAAVAATAEQIVVEEEIEVEIEVEVPAPIALYLMFDRSWSMEISELWEPAVVAITDFIDDEASAGMDLAMQYFPNHDAYPDHDDCTAERYGIPAIDVGRLPDHADALRVSLQAEDPYGEGTPIEGALRGLTEFCKGYQASRGEQCVAVLVTDGKPQRAPCEEDHDSLAAIARAAFEDHGVQTFAVGLHGADFALLDAIAVQGGAVDCDPATDRFACDVSEGPGALDTALRQIRDTVVTTETRIETRTTTVERPLACQWKMPEAKGDTLVEPNRVNVELRSNAGAVTLGRVPSAESCAEGAWHYDDNGAPARILACPQTCAWLSAGMFTEVEILLGCETETVLLE